FGQDRMRAMAAKRPHVGGGGLAPGPAMRERAPQPMRRAFEKTQDRRLTDLWREPMNEEGFRGQALEMRANECLRDCRLVGRDHSKDLTRAGPARFVALRLDRHHSVIEAALLRRLSLNPSR